MAGNANFLSQTLQSITLTKQHEQSKRRKNFEAGKTQIIRTADNAKDERDRLKALISGVGNLSFGNKGIAHIDEDRKSTLEVMSRYLEQSKFDPSISPSRLRGFESTLHKRLDQESERFRFADLYYRLLTEWTKVNGVPIEEAIETAEGLEGSFEYVHKYTLQNLKEQFSDVVFTPLETDEIEIDLYLNSMFYDDYARDRLRLLRQNITLAAEKLKTESNPFTKFVVKDCIDALRACSLLNDDANMTMLEFSKNDDVLCEITDVLNLRFADLENWSWEADEGIYYEPRKQINGKYRIMMDEDILQAIFLHYIAGSWCMIFKNEFTGLVNDERCWKTHEKVSPYQKARNLYFFGDKIDGSDIMSILGQQERELKWSNLLSSLPGSLTHQVDPYGGEDSHGISAGLEMRQKLLRQIASDVIIRQELYGDVAVVQSDLQWYATSLPHSTILAVMRFWGVPEDWIAFFKKFTQAPLRMDPTPGENVRIRKRGVPINNAFENLFGECVLFCMDVAVNRWSETPLFRFHDDLWLFGDPSTCAHAWETIEMFVRVLGLDINKFKTGSIYIAKGEKDAHLASLLPEGQVCVGLLQLTDKGTWVIDQEQVSSHVRQLKKQLGKATSIISWVQIWNACMGNFFHDVFGRPANCFGEAHVDHILETYSRMQRALFGSHNGSVTEYLQEKISHRFGVDDVPESFLFLPEACGGLGLTNPFISFFLTRKDLEKNPRQLIKDFQKQEKKDYLDAKNAYAKLSETQRHDRFVSAFGSPPTNTAILSEPFPPFSTLTDIRLNHSVKLWRAYEKLMQTPQTQGVELSQENAYLFNELKESHGLSYEHMTEEKWLMNLYADELRGKFGSLSIVDKNMLPEGTMKMIRERRKPWQLIHWD
ncbi:unnamed protein product [Periconia digitata]|uniref:Reverse transcriptase domain-containing protein n=1 Tax=Periconia digitata TaxID=1303443 RepID=A0A9W4XPY5_9PLEO|nr:unnamed protein product [Periconia digitata]